MRATEEELKKNLIEMYACGFQMARKRELDDYEQGKADGLVHAVGSIGLFVFGGKAFYSMWETAMSHDPGDSWQDVASDIEDAIKRSEDE